MACFLARNTAFTYNNRRHHLSSFIVTTTFHSSTGNRPMYGLVPSKPPPPPLSVFSCDRRNSYSSLVLKAACLLGPPTRFEASKLKVIFMGEEIEHQPLSTIQRAYTLTHCDFTANLTLAVSNSITNNDMLREWPTTILQDDVVAEWKRVKEEMFLHVHCYVSGANPIQEIAAEFRYYIFCKELPLVLRAVVYGDSALFSEHPELMEAVVWVHFHSRSTKYNRVECWGPLKDAAQRTLDTISDKNSDLGSMGKWATPWMILHSFFAFLL